MGKIYERMNAGRRKKENRYINSASCAGMKFDLDKDEIWSKVWKFEQSRLQSFKKMLDFMIKVELNGTF